MSKSTRTPRAPMPQSIDEGKTLAKKYYDRMPALASEEGGKETPGGYKSFDDFLWTYLVPMGLNRLAALDKYRSANPPKPKAKRAKKAA